jgi:glycosyltransferase involved in cell wall biosynthesis
MKVLIIAFAFPPANVIGAVHVGKLARYLDRRNHDVRVLTTDLVEDRSLPLEISRERAIYTDYPERKSWFGVVARPFRNRSNLALDGVRADDPARGRAPRSALRRSLRRHYLGLTHIPDMRAAWMNAALPAGRRLIEEWRPDIIYASAPPHTGLVIARRLARSFRIPWVAGLRDLWVETTSVGLSWRRRSCSAQIGETVTSRAAFRRVHASSMTSTGRRQPGSW